jgi:FAD-dependent urate hydroxylase
VGVLGASASAFDNAAGALEAGAREVRLFSRRPQLPQINKSKWAAFPGFFHGLRDLDDDLKWQIYTYLFAVQTPPPHASVPRRDQHAGFVLHFAEPWLDVAPGASADGDPEKGCRHPSHRFQRGAASWPELARLHNRVLLWRDRVWPEEAARHPQPTRFL